LYLDTCSFSSNDRAVFVVLVVVLGVLLVFRGVSTGDAGEAAPGLSLHGDFDAGEAAPGLSLHGDFVV